MSDTETTTTGRERAREAVAEALEPHGVPHVHDRAADAASDMWEPMVTQRDARIAELEGALRDVADGYPSAAISLALAALGRTP